jgi:hypothetical protein
MSTHTPDKPAVVVPLAPVAKGQPDANIVADDSGRAIVALLHRAAEMSKDDSARAMDLAHRLSSQLRAAEERTRALEVEAAHFHDRAIRAEEWLQRIHNEVETAFFQKKGPRRPLAPYKPGHGPEAVRGRETLRPRFVASSALSREWASRRSGVLCLIGARLRSNKASAIASSSQLQSPNLNYLRLPATVVGAPPALLALRVCCGPE